MVEVLAICDGQAVELRSIHDTTFSQRLVGEGYAIRPSSTRFVSPMNGKIKLLFRSYHAFVIENEEGLDFLIHIGINTVSLNGAGFEAHVKEGDEVKTGDLLITVTDELLNNPKVDLTTLVLLLKPKNVKNLNIKTIGTCIENKTVMLTYDLQK